MKLDCLKYKGKTKNKKLLRSETTFVEAGRGETIVFLPPPLADHRIYCQVFEILQSKYHVLSYDLPLVDSLSDILEELKYILSSIDDKFHLVTSSATGWLIHQITDEIKPYLQSIILSNAFIDNTELRTKYRLKFKATKLIPGFKFRKEAIKLSKSAAGEISNRPSMIRYMKEMVKYLDKKQIRNRVSWILDSKDVSLLPDELDILIIYNRHDPFVEYKNTKKLIGSYSAAQIHNFNQRTHFPYIARPKKFAEVIDEFISII